MEYSHGYSYSWNTSSTIDPAVAAVVALVCLVLAVIMVVSMYKLFVKAGKPGWAAIVPFYNVIVELEIVGRPIWWFLLLFIPTVNTIIGIVLLNDLAKSFGRGLGFTFLLIFLPFIALPLLAFNNDVRYVGPAAA